ncbi:uncharacterized protein METZ01_LOCUS63097, partial [marine metagenome]
MISEHELLGVRIQVYLPHQVFDFILIYLM